MRHRPWGQAHLGRGGEAPERSQRGFVFIEVLATILVLAVGLVSAVALTRYGVRLAREAQAAALAEPTARSVLADTAPLGVPVGDFASTAADVWEGYVNGLWCRRTVADKSTNGGLTFATVTVEVFWSGEGERTLTLRERMLFHAP